MAKSITYRGQGAAGLEAPAMRAQGLTTSVRQAMADGDIARVYSLPDWPRVRAIVLRLCAGQCVACGSTFRLECDHIQPLAVAGVNSRPFDPSGLQMLCRHCHQAKTTELDTAGGMARAFNPARDKREPRLREILTSQGALMAQAAGVRVAMTMADVLAAGKDRQAGELDERDHVAF